MDRDENRFKIARNCGTEELSISLNGQTEFSLARELLNFPRPRIRTLYTSSRTINSSHRPLRLHLHCPRILEIPFLQFINSPRRSAVHRHRFSGHRSERQSVCVSISVSNAKASERRRTAKSKRAMVPGRVSQSARVRYRISQGEMVMFVVLLHAAVRLCWEDIFHRGLRWSNLIERNSNGGMIHCPRQNNI